MSLRAAVNAKCRWCIYDPLSGLGHWRQQTSACTIKTCPLWPVRPLTKGYAAEVANLAPLEPQEAAYATLDRRD